MTQYGKATSDRPDILTTKQLETRLRGGLKLTPTQIESLKANKIYVIGEGAETTVRAPQWFANGAKNEREDKATQLKNFERREQERKAGVPNLRTSDEDSWRERIKMMDERINAHEKWVKELWETGPAPDPAAKAGAATKVAPALKSAP